MKSVKKSAGKLFTVDMVCLCILGLVLNYALAQLVLFFELPVYMDNIGSVLVAVLGGPLAGMTVGFISNVLNSFTDPITLYYGILTVFIALTASVFSHRGWFRSIKGVLGAAACFVFFGGAVGSCVTWMLYGGGIGEGISEPYALALLDMGFSEFWAQFTADVLIDIPDKLITAFVVFGILKLYPRCLYNRFPYSYLYDRSKQEGDKVRELEKSRYRKLSVNTRIMTLISVSLICISVCSTVVAVVLEYQNQQEHYKVLASNTAKVAEQMTNGDSIEYFKRTGAESESYQEQAAKFRVVMDNTDGLKYLYVYQITDEGCLVIFDMNSQDMEGGQAGTVKPFDNDLEPYREILLAGGEIPAIVYSGSDGKMITACEPVKDSQGVNAAYVFVDISMSNIYNMTLTYIIKMFAIQFGLSLIIAGYATWYARERLAAPINSIVEQSQEFDAMDPAKWLESEQWLNRRDVRTGDEIEELYKTICQVEENVAQNVKKLKHSEELEKANRELAEAIEAAKEANAAKSAFLSRMSHDIRTPLNVIIGMSRLAQNNDNPDDTQECLSKINISSEFLLGLVNDILDMERIESGRTEIRMVPYTADEFRGYIETVIQPLCSEKGIDFIYSMDSDEELVMMQDKLHINQIYFNLLSNAVKFTPEGGKIIFRQRIERKDEHCAVLESEITDNGIGMSEEFQKHMFESFTQENQVMTSVSQGSGLGLAIVKHMCDLMGITISVKSKLGEGTSYFLSCESEIVDTEENLSVKDMEVRPDISVLKNKIILVCEDHLLNQEIVRRILEKEGMIPVIVEDGMKGLNAFVQSAPGEFAAILMDVRMPVMDGIEVTRRIRALPRLDAKTVPIIAMTANAYDTDRQLTVEAGMDAHLTKPVDAEKIYETLARLVQTKNDR